MTSPEELLVGFCVDMQTRELSPEVEEKAVHCLLDALSLGRAAGGHPVVRAVAESVGQGGGAAHLWATGASLHPADAALVNGTATHAFFQDDTDMTAWAHPASLIVPAVVAAAEAADAGFPQVLRGLVAGYATLSWLGAREEVARQLVEGGFRASPTLGAVAAAMGASTALSLDAEATHSALGIAADSTGGLLEPVRDGAQDWRLQNGFAAQRGVMCALLGRAGVRGPRRPLTGPRGFLATFTRGQVPGQWAEPPTEDAVGHVWFKEYPILGDNMAAAAAAATLTGRMPPASEVEEVVVGINAHFASYPGTAYQGPFERTEQMIASTAFNVASVLVAGSFRYEDYDRLHGDRDIAHLVSRTRVEPHEDYGYLDATVEVRTSEGVLSASAAEAPQEVFFRDRPTTEAVLARRGDGPLQRLAGELFDGLAGGAWPALSRLTET